MVIGNTDISDSPVYLCDLVNTSFIGCDTGKETPLGFTGVQQGLPDTHFQPVKTGSQRDMYLGRAGS